MLAIGPKVHRLKPSRGDGDLGEIKICNMPSFGGEVKLVDPCPKIFFLSFFSIPVCAITVSGVPGGTLVSMNHFSTL
jgi:hypothetical protein